jgi:hypothetical protein
MAGSIGDSFTTSGTGFEVYNPGHSGLIIKRCRRPMVARWNSHKHMAAWQGRISEVGNLKHQITNIKQIPISKFKIQTRKSIADSA